MPPIRKNYQSASDERTNNDLALRASSSTATTGNHGLIDAPIVPSHGMHMAAPYLRMPPFNAEQRTQFPAYYQSTPPPPPPPQQDAVYRQYQQSQQGFCNPQQGSWSGYQTASVQQRAPSGYAAGASATIGASQGNGTLGGYASASTFEYNPSTPVPIASVTAPSPSSSSPSSSPPSPLTILADYDLSSYPAPAGTLNPAHLFLPLDEIPSLSLRHNAPQRQPQPAPQHQHQAKAKTTQNLNQQRQRAPVEAIDIDISNVNMGMGMGTKKGTRKGTGTGNGTGRGKGIGIRTGNTVRYAPLVPSAQIHAPSQSQSRSQSRSQSQAPTGINTKPGIGAGVGVGIGSAPRYTPSVSYAPPSASTSTSSASASASATAAWCASQANASSRATSMPRRTQKPEQRIGIPDPYSHLDTSRPVQGSMLWNTAIPMNGMSGAGPSSLRQSNFASTQPVAMVPSVSKLASRNMYRPPSPVQTAYIEIVDSDDESETDDTQSSSDLYPETQSSVTNMPPSRHGNAPRLASSQRSGGAERYCQASQNKHFDLHHQEEVTTQHDLSNSSGAKKRKRSPPEGPKDHSTPGTSSSKQEPLQHTFKFVDHFAEVHERRLRSADAGHADDEGERAPKRRRSGSPVAPPGQRQFVMMDGITRKKRAPNGTNPTRTQPTQARTSNPEPKSKHSLQPVPPTASTAHLAAQPAENVQQPTLDDEHKVEEVDASSHRTTDDAFLALLEYNNDSVVLTGPLEDEYKAALSRIREKEEKRQQQVRKRQEEEART